MTVETINSKFIINQTIHYVTPWGFEFDLIPKRRTNSSMWSECNPSPYWKGERYRPIWVTKDKEFEYIGIKVANRGFLLRSDGVFRVCKLNKKDLFLDDFALISASEEDYQKFVEQTEELY